MGKKISVSQLSAAVMEAVQEYADTAVEEVKQAEIGRASCRERV